MIQRLFMFGVMSFGILGFGVFSWQAMHQAPPLAAAAPVPTIHAAPIMINVLVAARALQAGTFLQRDDLSSVAFAQDVMPPNAERDSEAARSALSGALIRRSLPHDAVILASDLLPVGDHGFLAAILRPGLRAFTIAHDQVVADAGLIWPGDRLDLILTQQAPNGAPPGRQTSGETVLTNVRVLAVDQQLVQMSHQGDGKSPAISTITVEVSPEEAQRLAVALRLGKLAFAVRPVAATSASADAAIRPTWADDVMHSLDDPSALRGLATIHVFDGQSGDKEFHY